MRRLAGGLVVWCAMSIMGSPAQAQDLVRPTTEEIAARMMMKNAERQAALASYTSERTYRLEYKGTGGERWAEIVVRVDYLGAGQKRLTVVAESGSKVICERVLRRMVEGEQEAAEKTNRMQTMLSPENYDMELEGEETWTVCARGCCVSSQRWRTSSRIVGGCG